MARALREDEIVALEQLIDATSLEDVLTAIGCVCTDKAQHIRVSYSDNLTAKRWEKARTVIERCHGNPAIGALT